MNNLVFIKEKKKSFSLIRIELTHRALSGKVKRQKAKGKNKNLTFGKITQLKNITTMKIQSMLLKINRVLVLLLLVFSVFIGIFSYNTSSSNSKQQDIGTVQKKLSDDVEDKVQGTVKQIKGRAKQDIGKTKKSIEEAGSDLEEASDNMIDTVKDFFGS